MADKKISQLTALSAANLAPSTDVLAIVDTSATETKKIVAQDLVNGVLNVASTVGIGTSSPATRLHVEGSAGQILRVTDGTTGASIYSGSGLFGFNNQTGEDGMFGSTASHYLYFATNGAERARFNTTGAFVFAGGTTTANGIGITFPATQSASSNANTLDDYEEGTFTPAVSGTTTAGTGTYSVQNGQYVKIGRLVQYQIYIVLTAHTGTGNIAITGLPFTAIPNAYPASSIYVDGLALTAGNYPQMAVLTSGTEILVRQYPTGGGAATAIPMDTQFDILLCGTYQV
jgi:hypothetical protein